ncbi:MAG: hypothetical protein WBO23_03290 [Burkholderiales bacterium]
MKQVILPASVCAFLAAVLVATAAAQQAAPAPRMGFDGPQLAKRLESVGTLLESSSAARQVEASGNREALAKRERARELHRQALEAYRSGDLGKASRLLPEASVQMFEAVRMSAPEQVSEPKLRADFQARIESVNALLAAYRRIAVEKAGIEGGAETVRAIEKLVAQAEEAAGAGRFAPARTALDQAYLVAKAAIRSARGGDTLVRSLHFGSAEEEYHYEVDRNDTHRMLIGMLLQNKGESPAVRDLLDKAKTSRARAEDYARGSDFKSAIRMLEESTRDLVRAIRGAGVYIPG